MATIYEYQKPESGSSKVKVKGVTFWCIKNKNLNEMVSVKNKIVFEKPKTGEPSILIEGTLYRIAPLEQDEKITGYVCTVQGEVFAFKKPCYGVLSVLREKPSMTGMLIALFVLFILFVWESTQQPDDSDKGTLGWQIAEGIKGDEIKLNHESSSSGSNVFNGYSEAWVSETYQTLPLVNSEKNTTYAKYMIFDGDTLVYETDLIAPNTHIEWNAYESLNDIGIYTLTQTCKFYEPQYDEGGNIIGFTECGVGITNPSFVIEKK